jgi:anti-anti-sigma factor
MPAGNSYRPPAVVALPDEIDLTNREVAYDQLYAAFAAGASVVIADLSGTSFCDCASLRRLVMVQNRAAAQNAQLRLVIRPGSAVHRLATLIGLDRQLPVYPSVPDAGPPPGHADHSGPGRGRHPVA